MTYVMIYLKLFFFSYKLFVWGTSWHMSWHTSNCGDILHDICHDISHETLTYLTTYPMTYVMTYVNHFLDFYYIAWQAMFNILSFCSVCCMCNSFVCCVWSLDFNVGHENERRCKNAFFNAKWAHDWMITLWFELRDKKCPNEMF